MSEKKNTSILNFFKKNLYYFMIGVSLIIIATVIAVVLSTSNATSQGGIKESLHPLESVKESIVESATENEKEPEDNESSKPTDTKIIFTLPVNSGTIIKNYTSSTVVFNQTLGVYTGHMGIDFGAEAGSEVLSAYAGIIESITSSNSVVTMPVLRPLIGFDKLEIIEISRKIDTYKTSILPYEDCCTVFLPKYPLIKPRMDRVLEAESKLDVEALIEEAMENVEVYKL